MHLRLFINQAEQLQQQWYLGQRKVLIIASTHAPEEQQILQALAPYLKVRSGFSLYCRASTS